MPHYEDFDFTLSVTEVWKKIEGLHWLYLTTKYGDPYGKCSGAPGIESARVDAQISAWLSLLEEFAGIPWEEIYEINRMISLKVSAEHERIRKQYGTKKEEIA